jgi:hypothetical protein
VISGQSRMMYQSLEPEPEGAICPQRSLPQALHSSPHDTDTSIAYWLEANIQGTFSCSGSRTMLARPVAMVIFDDKQGTRSRRIYWHGVQ